MEVEEARKILAENGNDYNDSQLQLIIDSFNKIIEVGFQQFEALNPRKEFDNVVSTAR